MFRPVHFIARVMITRAIRHSGIRSVLRPTAVALFSNLGTFTRYCVRNFSLMEVIPVLWHLRKIFYVTPAIIISTLEAKLGRNSLIIRTVKDFLKPYTELLEEIIKTPKLKKAKIFLTLYTFINSIPLLRPVSLYLIRWLFGLISSTFAIFFNDFLSSIPFLLAFANSVSDFLRTYFMIIIPKPQIISQGSVEKIRQTIYSREQLQPVQKDTWNIFTLILFWSAVGFVTLIGATLVLEGVAPDLNHSIYNTVSSYMSSGYTSLTDCYHSSIEYVKSWWSGGSTGGNMPPVDSNNFPAPEVISRASSGGSTSTPGTPKASLLNPPVNAEAGPSSFPTVAFSSQHLDKHNDPKSPWAS